MDQHRIEYGLNNFKKLSGKEDNPFASLGDLGDYILEYGFGDIYGRDTISWRDRQISTMSIQIVMGCIPQFKLHARFSLNIGITKEEIFELILHTTPYAGFPRAMNAHKAFEELLDSLSSNDNTGGER
ncbi:MAG: carboxymuconolactone decarboxylase family protein [Clostridiales Family XIII bacterium]|jgi:4-carboxymuconolactone decarboxylase|nr:carboxymuconolactone decarboxylase family protein [Clostridiales Family XIII bacterium]